MTKDERMKTLTKIFLAWMIAILGGLVCLVVFPNENPSIAALLVDATLFLLGLVCIFIYLREPSRTNRPIFLNFAALFLLSVFAFISKFIGFAVGDAWSRFYFGQYHQLAYFFVLSFAIAYVVIDSLFTDFRTRQKYIITFLIVGSTFAYYYYPFFENPKHLYTTEDVADFKATRQAVQILESRGKTNPTVDEIASVTILGVWRDGKQVGILFDDQKVRRVAELLPYLKVEDNFGSLLYKPLFLNNIYMSVLCVVFIFLFFGYQYKNDPPQGAYIEKIIFLFLPYCSLEILHHYAYIKSVEYVALLDVQQIGYYLTLLNLILLLTFFGLRLRFITSVKGEFYERELVSDAEHISRWRDAFDNLVVRHFLNPKALHGRLLAPRAPRTKA